jgi:hypothetical protein
MKPAEGLGDVDKYKSQIVRCNATIEYDKRSFPGPAQNEGYLQTEPDLVLHLEPINAC